MKNLPYLLALHSIDGLGPIRLKKIIDYFKDPKLAWEAKERTLISLGIPTLVVEVLAKKRLDFDPFKYIEEIEKEAIKILTIFDDSYPQRLKTIYDPPVVIYYQGEILDQDRKALAVVGTRKMTGYGREVTRRFTTELVQKSLTIVSGLARGIDTIAHQTALEVGGRTIAVLGGGLNKIFPPENTGLVERIIDQHGAVLSEYPPDYPALAGNFPSRNRIIAGLSMGVLVTEAAEDSGSLITAKLALDEGREIFAVPGPVTSALSKGPADLIKEGARLAFCVEDILEELGIDKLQSENLKAPDYLKLSDDEKLIISCLENEGKHIDEIIREVSRSSAQVSATLVKMEIMGLVKNLGGGNYIKA